VSKTFDPYHLWLGIPASEQPPNHYRLLGIPLFEESPTVVENAADQRMAHLRTFQAGQHSVLSQKLLNEVATAKICLLNPEKKTAYDGSLQQKLRPTILPMAQPLPDPSEAGLAEVFQTRIASTSAIAAKSRRRRPKSEPTALIAAAVMVVVAVGFAVWVTIGHDSPPGNGEVAELAAPATSAKLREQGSPKPTAPAKSESPAAASTEPKLALKADEPKAVLDTILPEMKVVEKTRTAPIADKTFEAKPAVKATAVDTAKPSEEPATAKKLLPPSADEQKRLLREIDEIYKPGGIKDQADKAALARKLLDGGRKNEANRAEQFVLLRRAGEIACDAGELDLMLEAVDAIAEAGFEIRPSQVKARFLKQLLAQRSEGGAAQLSAIGALCEKIAEEAAASGAIGEALDVLDAAGKSLAKLTTQVTTAQRAAKAALARARTPADKAEREKKAGEAQQELEAIKSAQLAVSECAKGLQQARHEHAAILAAQERLKTDPDDAAACLAVGRWLCFNEGNWDEGLKLLAKGSDATLKSLAAEELASRPINTERRVARGDAWWDLAEKADRKTKAAMRQRAAHWYQEAMPDLAPGLAKLKVEKRLAQALDEPTPHARNKLDRIRPLLAVAPFNEKTAGEHQTRWARYLHVPVVHTNSLGIKVALIPPGEFTMGSPKELIDEELKVYADDEWYPRYVPGEGPPHRVRITKPFWLGVTEVTQEQYQSVMDSNPSRFQGDPKRPVEMVSCEQAMEFCRRLSELPKEKAAKRQYRLPTEAQWEYACRAGSTGRWCFSDPANALPRAAEEKLLGEYAWFNANAGEQTHPAGQKRASAWGLYDMYGNVFEWCQDPYEPHYYAESPTDDPTGPAESPFRPCRGGSWFLPPRYSRSAFRFCHPAGACRHDLGFRVAAIVAEESGK